MLSKDNTIADYYPFGMPMPNRQTIGGETYRYSFQGQEKDPETGKEAFELRLWDGRIGRWLSPDPEGQFNSPYLGIGNNPLNLSDPNGGSAERPNDWYKDKNGNWVYNENINGLQDFLDLGLDFDGAEYFGASGSETDIDGNITRLFENGTFQINGAVYNYSDYLGKSPVGSGFQVEGQNFIQGTEFNLSAKASDILNPYVKVVSFFINSAISQVGVIKENGYIPQGNQIYKKGFSKPYFYELSNFNLRKVHMNQYTEKQFVLDGISVTPVKINLFKSAILNKGAGSAVKKTVSTIIDKTIED